ncbi:MAG: peptide deformylase [Elusimicrobiales bacterium]|nr:peptide deformylase [Elusimicrobiales bacterium]HOJ87059.1 peptide deformylase [Elusimicrobiales bacterium]HOL62497.1 peptide deformylase [Elusimicrobiales bacterium]
MAVKRIIKYGEKILRKKTKKIVFSEIKSALPSILKDMYDTMLAANGVGLAANQIGLDMQLSIINFKDKEKNKNIELVIINPVIISSEGEVFEDEGCLSFPGLFAKIKRYKKVTVRALNEKGLPIEINADGLLAKALQHEIDHLNGITFIDHLPFTSKLKLKPTLLKLKRQWKKIDESKLKPDVM